MEIPYTVHPRQDTGLYNAKVGIWLFLASEVMLFGGLFSAYIILRIGAPIGSWPHNLLNVPIGFFNTLVLIASSVTVVLAWASLKMKQFGRFKFYQGITLLCAITFVAIKSFEYHDKWTHYDVRFQTEAAAQKAFQAAYGTNYMEAAEEIYHFRYGKQEPFTGILGVPFTGHLESRTKNGKEIEGTEMWFNTQKLQSRQDPIDDVTILSDPLPGHEEHGNPVKILPDDVRRMTSYVPEHSTYFSIYFTLTALHALHVIGGALVIAYLWGPGSKMWKTDPERFTNRIEVSGLFWHFVDLVWIFLFPVLYLL